MNPREYDIYQMNEERQQKLWANCLFVFDTSALLALYMYPENTRQQIYQEIFEKIKHRLWIPHHVYFEFLKNRAAKIREPISRNYLPLKEDFVKPIVESFSKSLNRVDALKNNIKNAGSHPYMVSEELEQYEVQLKKFMNTTVEFERAFSEQMDQKIREIMLLEQNDTVFQHIQQYFKVGREYTYNEILQITKEGKHRFEFKIPPGYEDLKDKIGTQIFGDLIIWKQLLEHAKESGSNVVFVNNDVKEDWWELTHEKGPAKRKTNGPRRELVKELKDHAGKDFWMYTQAAFLDIANMLIKSNISNRFIEQISPAPPPRLGGTYIAYTCDHCKEENVVNTATLDLRFEAEKKNKNTEVESKYKAQAHFNCPNCKNTIGINIEVWEQPLGIIHQQHILLQGATVLKESETEHDTEGYDPYYTPQEETHILSKKQLRLKAGKPRNIVLNKSVDSSDTIFQVELRKPDHSGTIGRLRVEVSGSNHVKNTKVLELENGITRFVMHSYHHSDTHHFFSLQLDSDTNMTIFLSIIEFPGTGRYIEKLYY
ncbi:MAG TPA: PIN domain-containing protein [Bacteroidia bacterium]